MAKRKTPQSPALQDQVPNQMRIGIEFPLDSDMPESEMTFSGNWGWWVLWFLGAFYHVNVEALEDWTEVTNFMMGGLGFSLEDQKLKPISVTSSQLCMGINAKKRIFSYTTKVIEQLKALITVCFVNWLIIRRHSGRSESTVRLLWHFESS